MNVTFIEPDGERVEVTAFVGDSILETAHANDIELEGQRFCSLLQLGISLLLAGACEASLACSTCHVILPKKIFKTLPEVATNRNRISAHST